MNPYRYAPNPLGWADPWGLKRDEVIRYMGKEEAKAATQARGERAVWCRITEAARQSGLIMTAIQGLTLVEKITEW
ncbi:hypothetical protein GGER_46100 [Serratia rubidaea]